MKRSKFSEEQIACVLRQVEAGTPVADVCRQVGVSEATFYVWKEKYAGLGSGELRRLRQLEDENARLKRVVADLTLDCGCGSGRSRTLGHVLASCGSGCCCAARAGGSTTKRPPPLAENCLEKGPTSSCRLIAPQRGSKCPPGRAPTDRSP